MFAELKVFQAASALTRHAGIRQTVIARNMANSDTPGYRALDVAPFTLPRDTQGQGGWDFDVIERRGAAASRNGNTVDLETEMVEAIDTQRQHERAIAIYKSSMSLLRTSLGRR